MKPNPVRIRAASGQTLATRLRRLEKYIKRSAEATTWESQEQYNEWALGFADRFRPARHAYVEEIKE